MCRNIKTLFNFEPPATDEEIRAASLQFVRKLSGFNTPSKANKAAFDAAIEEVFQTGHRLLHGLKTQAPQRDRETEVQKARARSAERFGAAPPPDERLRSFGGVKAVTNPRCVGHPADRRRVSPQFAR